MKRTTWAIVIALLIVGLAAQAQQGRKVDARANETKPETKSVPWTINYQGYLTGSDTLPIQGNVPLTLNIYDAPSGGSLLWGPEAHAVVPVTKGFFNVQLGSILPFTAGIFDGNQRYLEIAVNGTTLAPRKPLGSVGYAIRSQRADTADYAYPTAHDHIGQTWSSASSTLGLKCSLNVDTTSNVDGIRGEVSNAGAGPAYGGNFYAAGTGTGNRFGVFGSATAPSGSANTAFGSYGYSSHDGTGVAYGGNFYASGTGTGTKYGVRGIATHPSISVNPFYGIYGWGSNAGSGAAYGGCFHASGVGSGTKYGVYSSASGGGTIYAGYFEGNVVVTGSLSKGGGSFLIDHPLDPQNKTLRHNFVESPENLCLYRGKVKLNSSGEGKVEMPTYFKALTKETEATVTLTSIGRPFNSGYEWSGDCTEFTVYGDPNREVSYIVMADRDDPVMKQLYKPVEEDKGNGNFTKGKLLYPKAYGYSENMGEDYEHRKRAEEEAKKASENKPKNDLMSPPEGR